MTKALPIAAAIMAAVLVTGYVDVNIDHHLKLPPELTSKNSSTITQHFMSKTIDIRLTSTIGSEDSVRDILKILQEANHSDTIRFHIAGFGGQVETVLLLINNIRASKAHTIMVVEAPAYSGYAYLAVAGKEIIMLPYSYLMFHTSSAYGSDCSSATGTDRTVSKADKCRQFLKIHLFETDKYIDQISILTEEEKTAIKTGHDVYVTSEEFNKRISSNKKAPKINLN